jgi:hypothetical protein
MMGSFFLYYYNASVLNLILNPILDSRQAPQNHFEPLISPHALISTSHLPNLGPIERL